MCVFGFFIGGLNFIGLGMIENGADTPDNLVWTWVLELYRLEWDLNRVVIEGSDRAKVEYYGSSMSEDFTFDDEATSIFEEKRIISGHGAYRGSFGGGDDDPIKSTS
jgi:hypothetical protein